MNKRAWAMTAPLVVLVALLVASCGDDSPTGSSPAPLTSADVEPPLTLVGFGLTSTSEAPLAGVYVHGNYAYVGGMSSGYNTSANIGVRIVDLSNPANPRLVGRIPLRTLGTYDSHSHGGAVVTHIDSGAFQGDVAMVLYGVPDEFDPTSYPQPHGIWDVTNPCCIRFLSVLNLGNAPHGNEGGDLGDKPYDAMAAAGNYFYTLYDRGTRSTPRNKSNQDTRLAVVDASDSRRTKPCGRWGLGGQHRRKQRRMADGTVPQPECHEGLHHRLARRRKHNPLWQLVYSRLPLHLRYRESLSADRDRPIRLSLARYAILCLYGTPDERRRARRSRRPQLGSGWLRE